MIPRSNVASETPLAELLKPLTPNETFFVRSHAREVPRIAAADYCLTIAGVRGVRELTLAELRSLPRIAQTITLACAGNGRTAFDPVPSGVPWGMGAISTAHWEGTRLRDVLQLAGILENAAHAVFDGYDGPSHDGKPPYRRSLPLARALADGTILADTMNGEPLPPEHGGPVRLVVGGWTANHSMKWLRGIGFADRPDDGWWMNDYRVPGPDGAPRMIEAPAPIAILASPLFGETWARNAVLEGIAYGEPAPARVRVDVDGANAGETEVRYGDGPYAWGRWSLRLALSPGPHRLAIRPVGANGVAAPMRASWNASGYRYDGPHLVDVVVSE
ncbi:MAG TPA: molybdopterin-dependent oxidoreductase [Candidatus Elarobacter sp.]|nr:molybdopterin-dependent oxidoreductase [Candidatus Elarobacter sp.]